MTITTSGLKDLITSYSQENNNIIMQLNTQVFQTDARISEKLVSFFQQQGILVELSLHGWVLSSVDKISCNKLLRVLKDQGILSDANPCLDETEEHSLMDSKSDGSVDSKSDGEDQDGFFSWDEELSRVESCPEYRANDEGLSWQGNRARAFTWTP